MKMSAKQTELWKLVEKERIPRGSFAEGSREWALNKSRGLASGILSDEDCENLINIITK